MSQQRLLQPTSEQIARAAYQLWELEGRPEGRDVAHWLRAETQLRASADAGGSDGRRVTRAGSAAPRRPAATRRPKPRL
jgi:hypothetical protein